MEVDLVTSLVAEQDCVEVDDYNSNPVSFSSCIFFSCSKRLFFLIGFFHNWREKKNGLMLYLSKFLATGGKKKRKKNN